MADIRNTEIQNPSNPAWEISGNLLVRCIEAEGNVIVPEGITEIGDNAFFRCDEIVSIELPETVSYIGNSAFKYCDNAVCITMPKEIKFMGAEVFQYCWKLKELILPEGVTSIGETMLEGCTNLERLVIPNSVSRVPRTALSTCRKLRHIELDMKKLEILPYSARNYAVLGYISANTYGTSDSKDEQQCIVDEYIRNHNRSFFNIALSSDSKAAVNYIIANELLKDDLIDIFIDESTSMNRGEITAMLLTYKNRLGLVGKEAKEVWNPFA